MIYTQIIGSLATQKTPQILTRKSDSAVHGPSKLLPSSTRERESPFDSLYGGGLVCYKIANGDLVKGCPASVRLTVEAVNHRRL